MNFERVKREEADTVLKLYRSLLGTPYCVWTEDYPSEKEVEFDLSRDALFCMRDAAENETAFQCMIKRILFPHGCSEECYY